MKPTAAHSRSRGAWAEDIALDFLRQRGLESVQRNYRCKAGELDLICADVRRLIFVEVRYRRANALVSAAESISARKRQRLRLAAAHFLMIHRMHAGRPCRFDVITVTGSREQPEIDWIQDAFQDDA